MRPQAIRPPHSRAILGPLPSRSRRWRRLHPVIALRRRPRLRYTAAAALAALAGLTVHSAAQGAAEARQRWGEPVTVAVAREELPAGRVVQAGDVELRRLPAALVPDGALGEAPVGATVREPVYRGEPVLAARLAAPGLSGVAAMLPPGARALALPADPGTLPPLAVGDRVDVLVSVDPASTAGPPAVVLARRAMVVDVSQDAVTVAVPEQDALRVAFAASAGAVALALVGE